MSLMVDDLLSLKREWQALRRVLLSASEMDHFTVALLSDGTWTKKEPPCRDQGRRNRHNEYVRSQLEMAYLKTALKRPYELVTHMFQTHHLLYVFKRSFEITANLNIVWQACASELETNV